MLDVINAQGAQVTQLQAELASTRAVLQALAARVGSVSIDRQELEEAPSRAQSVSWELRRSGALVITVKSEDGKKLYIGS